MVKNVNFILQGRTGKLNASRGQAGYTEMSEANGYKQQEEVRTVVNWRHSN